MSHARSNSSGTIFNPTAPLPRPNEDVQRRTSSGEDTSDEYSETINFEDASTRSVSASVFNFHKENGRTYHGYRAGSYNFPNDASEIERLEYQHILMHHCLGERLAFAPIPPPEALAHLPHYDSQNSSARDSMRMLDIGCGTGTYAIELADMYPSALVEATDLSPIQPTYGPANVNFIIDDAEQEDWAIPHSYYDYIHTRFMLGSFRSYKDVVKRAYIYCKEGGYMESQEVDMRPHCSDGTMPNNWKMKEWCELLIQASGMAGRSLDVGRHLKQWYVEAGFVDVQERIFRAPIGPWEEEPGRRDLGHWWVENWKLGLQGFSLALLTRGMDWSPEQVEVFLVSVRKSFEDPTVHAYHNVHVVTGRKPTKEETIRMAQTGQKRHFDELRNPGPSTQRRSSMLPSDRDVNGHLIRKSDEDLRR